MGTGLAPGMRQLDTGHGPLSANKAGNALQGFDLFVIPQPKVLGSDTSLRDYGGGFGKNQPSATNSAATQMD